MVWPAGVVPPSGLPKCAGSPFSWPPAFPCCQARFGVHSGGAVIIAFDQKSRRGRFSVYERSQPYNIGCKSRKCKPSGTLWRVEVTYPFFSATRPGKLWRDEVSLLGVNGVEQHKGQRPEAEDWQPGRQGRGKVFRVT